MKYTTGTSSVCKDFRCCHVGDVVANETDAAKAYGNLKCGTSLNGFKKLMDTINELNQTEEFAFSSVLYGGSSSSYDPQSIKSDDDLNLASKSVYEKMRLLNPFNGIYFAVGPYDLYTLNY